MSGLGPTDLHDLCAELLDASEAALDTIPTFAPGLGGAPERSYVSPGLPALDCCPQLTVHATSVADAPTSPAGLGAGRRAPGKKNHVGLAVTIVRCIPTVGEDGVFPSVAQMEEASDQIDADGWALWNHVYNLWRAEALSTLCSEVFFDALRPVNPSGGCAGWVLNVRMTLDGYEEVIP